MAKNDVVLIDSLLRNRSHTGNIGEEFELFVIEQILKNHDLTRDEIDDGWIDGSHDGGIDGFYIFINGRPLSDPTDFPWPRTGAEIELVLLTCKHHPTFQQATLDALLASIQELFDLSKPTAELSGKYSSELRRSRDLFVAAYDRLSLYRPTVSFRVIYASRGDTAILGESVAARGSQIEALLRSYFSASTATFSALGAAELVDLHREVRSFSLDLPVHECLTAGQEGYVVLAKLTDYRRFIRDDNGELRRYLFDSNVRAFLGANSVNGDIAETLREANGPNFWWLNNGITILATSASLVGKTLKMRDIQIVNGLQTSESAHKVEISDSDPRSLLVKVIVSDEERVRDKVIRATNNQTAVEPAALHATDRIQQDIEDILLRSEWFYERRTNYFRNEGRPEGRIIRPLILATGSVALLLKNPVASSKLRQKAIRTPGAYTAVYGTRFPLDCWPVVASIIRSAEEAIVRSNLARRGSRAAHLATWRGILAYVIASRLLGTFSYSLQDLARLPSSPVDETFANECWDLMRSSAGGSGKGKVSDSRMQKIAEAMSSTWSVVGDRADGRVPLPRESEHWGNKRIRPNESEQFIQEVHAALPPQPWKPGVHRAVATKLGVEANRVGNAVAILISRKKRHPQVDGVVYDQEGREIARDHSRAPKDGH